METRCARQRARRTRVELQLYRGAGDRQYRELGAFVRYCVSRLEREFGEVGQWSVTIEPSGGAFASVVSLHGDAHVLASEGVGLDGALAAWEAMCKLEQSLREARVQNASNEAPARPFRGSLVGGVGRAG